MVVTLACLPLLVLDLLGGQSGGSSTASVVNTDVPESSLVVAVSPSDAPTTIEPSTTSTVTASPSAAKATTTTTTPKATTSSKAVASTKAPAATTSTTAPPVTYVAPAPVASTAAGWESSFLACVRQRESHNTYTAVDPTGTFMGAYQIYQGGWDTVARSIGRGDLVGVRPNLAAPGDQDAIALAMLRQYGKAPWGGTCG